MINHLYKCITYLITLNVISHNNNNNQQIKYILPVIQCDISTFYVIIWLLLYTYIHTNVSDGCVMNGMWWYRMTKYIQVDNLHLATTSIIISLSFITHHVSICTYIINNRCLDDSIRVIRWKVINDHSNKTISIQTNHQYIMLHTYCVKILSILCIVSILHIHRVLTTRI